MRKNRNHGVRASRRESTRFQNNRGLDVGAVKIIEPGEGTGPENFRCHPGRTSCAERSNQGYDSEVDETIAGNVRPALCRQRSPTDADHDRQFESEKGTALPIPTAPGATECARAGPFASV